MSCCNEEQQYFIVTIMCYLLAIFAMWRSLAFKPFKIFSVFLHELSHAIAATATCNRVEGIEVTWSNEGGLCTYRGRIGACTKCVVLPAGYIGSTLWGCGLTIACGFENGARFVGIVLFVALLVTLFYGLCGKAKGIEERCTIVALCICFGALVCGLTAFDFSDSWKHSEFLLESVVLFIGCTNMMYATYDIYDDTVRRKDERSDAYQYAQLAPCLFARCVGLFWFLLALTACALSIWATIDLVDEDNSVGKDGGSPCFSCLPGWKLIPGLSVLGIAIVVTAFSCFCCRAGKSTGSPFFSW